MATDPMIGIGHVPPHEPGATRRFDQLFVGGEWVAPESSEELTVHSPATEDPVTTFPLATTGDIDRAVAAARAAHADRRWASVPPAERAAAVGRLADELEARLERLVAAVTAEVGSPITASNATQRLSIDMVRATVELAGEVTYRERRTSRLGDSVVVREPVGVVAAIPPWNGPLVLSLAKLVPALLAGNTVVLKPPVEAPATGFVIAEAVAAAGIPDGVVSVVPAGREVGEHLVRHPGIDKVSFTGSTATGRHIAAICGDRLVRGHFELGGKSAAVVLPDADLDKVVRSMTPGAFGSAGQMCNALTRLVVHRSRHDEVVDAIVAAAGSLVLGDPWSTDTTTGPLISARQHERVLGFIERAVAEGATVATGGGRPALLPKGHFVEPTVLTGVTPSMEVAREEVFGPVLSVIPYDGDDDEAVAIANDSVYGLHGAVFTEDAGRAAAVATAVEAGTFSINCFASNLAAPFGGYKQSGIGRQYGPEGIEEYTELKTINDPEHVLG